MKTTRLWLNFLAGLLISVSALAQTVPQSDKMSVSDRMARARATKADKKLIKTNHQDTSSTSATLPGTKTTPKSNSLGEEKALPADYQAPVVKSLKGPHGEVVHTGEKGGKYYINKNGNKTYLSSNQ